VTLPAIEFLSDWRRLGVEPLAQRDYVKGELLRVASLGAPVLTLALTAALPVQTSLALSILHEEPLPGHRWMLRLLDGAVPPVRDPQGRMLPPDKAGRVLVAKVGTLGGHLRNTSRLPEAVTAPYSGTAVAARSIQGKDIYRYVELTRDPCELTLTDCVTLLRQYGVGIQPQRYLHRSRLPSDPRGGPVDMWMLEEVPPAKLDELRRAGARRPTPPAAA
jgi:hypothetical protein